MRSSSAVAAALALGSATLVPAPRPARAFSVGLFGTEPIRRADPVVTLGREIDVDEGALLRAAAAWTDLGCSAAAFVDGGESALESGNLGAGGGPDGKNDVVRVEDDFAYGAAVLAITVPVVDAATGFLVEADVVLNARDHVFTDGGEGGPDLESVLVHELGHVLGLRHVLEEPAVPWDPPTMTPGSLPGDAGRSLHADDEAGLCWLYPDGGVPGPCASLEDCPVAVDDLGDGEEVVGASECDLATGACGTFEVWGGGDGALGAPCEDDLDCRLGSYCLPFDEDDSDDAGGPAALCTSNCAPASGAACPPGFECRPFDSYPGFGACLPTSPKANVAETKTTVRTSGSEGCGAAPSDVASRFAALALLLLLRRFAVPPLSRRAGWARRMGA